MVTDCISNLMLGFKHPTVRGLKLASASSTGIVSGWLLGRGPSLEHKDHFVLPVATGLMLYISIVLDLS